MKHFILFLTFAAISNFLIAQSCGLVLDQITHSPVPYCEISFEETDTIIYTNNNGEFCFDLPYHEIKTYFKKESYQDNFKTILKNSYSNIYLIKSETIYDGTEIKDEEPVVIYDHIDKELAPADIITEDDAEINYDVEISEEIYYNSPSSPELESSVYETMPSKTGSSSRGSAKGSSSGYEKNKAYTDDVIYESKIADMEYYAPSSDVYISKPSTGKHKKHATTILPGGCTTYPAPTPAPRYHRQKRINAGTLTAGEIDDFAKWDLWNDIKSTELKQYSDQWKIYPSKRFTVQVNVKRYAAVNAKVKLHKNNLLVWEGRTDNTGKAELWDDYYLPNKYYPQQGNYAQQNNYQITIVYNGKLATINNAMPFSRGVNYYQFDDNCIYSNNLDIAMVVDATGSMGDEIDYLKVELLDVIKKVQYQNNNLNIRLGNVFYRDMHDEYVTKYSQFSNNIHKGIKFINEQYASGGGDFPEAVDMAMEKAINGLNWQENAIAKIMFLVLDAPPHQNSQSIHRIQNAIKSAAAKGIRIVPVTASGIDKSAEYLLRSIALATNGNYLFLTDHSGVGGHHIAPSTDHYRVKHLNDLMFEVINRYSEYNNCSQPSWFRTNPQVENNEEIKIYPNPGNGQFYLKSKVGLDNVFITDTNGKILRKLGHLIAGTTYIDLWQYPNGIYYVRYDIKNITKTQRILINK